ncbi:hypothetical protein K9M42_00650 [Patescibacteria group bacterium]|nr:hypothetical protein [Patescibacteria group bacterium]
MESNILNLFDSCKSDEDYISIMKENEFDPDFCEYAIQFLKKQKNIMFVMEKTGFASNVCKAGFLLFSN